MALGDVNGDGRPDIVAGNTLGTVGVLLDQAGGTFAAAATYPSGSFPIGVALGDFNGDGRLDIVTANFGSGTVGVVLNTMALASAAALTATQVSVFPNPVHGSFQVGVPAVAGANLVQAELLNALG